MLNKSLVTILVVIIIGFLIAFYALLMQVFGIESDDKSGIISGILSMVGGMAGAFGAYYVASMQMKEQFKKQDRDRVIELRVLKLNETLELANDFLHLLQVWRGLMWNVEMRVMVLKEKGYTHVVESSIFHDNEQDEIKKNIHRLVSLKDKMKKNKIFLSGLSDLEGIYNSTMDVVESNKKFINSFAVFKTKDSLELADVGFEFYEITAEVENNYKKLDSEVRILITLIENSIKELLNLE